MSHQDVPPTGEQESKQSMPAPPASSLTEFLNQTTAYMSQRSLSEVVTEPSLIGSTPHDLSSGFFPEDANIPSFRVGPPQLYRTEEPTTLQRDDTGSDGFVIASSESLIYSPSATAPSYASNTGTFDMATSGTLGTSTTPTFPAFNANEYFGRPPELVVGPIQTPLDSMMKSLNINSAEADRVHSPRSNMLQTSISSSTPHSDSSTIRPDQLNNPSLATNLITSDDHEVIYQLPQHTAVPPASDRDPPFTRQLTHENSHELPNHSIAPSSSLFQASHEIQSAEGAASAERFHPDRPTPIHNASASQPSPSPDTPHGIPSASDGPMAGWLPLKSSENLNPSSALLSLSTGCSTPQTTHIVSFPTDFSSIGSSVPQPSTSTHLETHGSHHPIQQPVQQQGSTAVGRPGGLQHGALGAFGTGDPEPIIPPPQASSGLCNDKISSGAPRRALGAKETPVNDDDGYIYAISQKHAGTSVPHPHPTVEPNQFPRHPQTSRHNPSHLTSAPVAPEHPAFGASPEMGHFLSSSSHTAEFHRAGPSPSIIDPQTHHQSRSEGRLALMDPMDPHINQTAQYPHPGRDPNSGYAHDNFSGYTTAPHIPTPLHKHGLGPQNRQYLGALTGSESPSTGSQGIRYDHQDQQYVYSHGHPQQGQQGQYGSNFPAAPSERLSSAAVGVTGPPVAAPWKFTYMTTTSEFDMRYSPNRPTPYDFDALWDSNHVKMPCSTKNRIYSPSNVAKPIRRWDIIRSKLQGRTFQSVAELEKVIRSYNPTYASKWGPFTALNKLATLDPNFLTKTLPYIIGMAMAIDAWFFQPIPLLRAQSAKTLIFSQAQCVSLIANMFLCTFPRRAPRHWTKKNEYSDFPDVSFDGLFTRDEDTALAKLQCFVGYFNAHMSKLPGSPDREVRFTRKVLGGLNVLKWSKCNASLSRFQVVPNAGLETMNGMWQADFANKMIGGGVLGRGAVQEEIRFSISPELLVSRLFTQELQDNEALLMTGSQQYVSYSGYAQSFRLKEPYEDIAVIKRGLVTKVIALDALTYENSNPLDQFTASDTIRELNKAYIAFSASCESEAMEPVATGRWGCGVFKGNASWKFLIQLLACSAAGRPMTFCTMNDNPLTGSLSSFCQFLDSLPTRPTVQSVYRIMASFQPSSDSDDVLPFIMHHLALKPTPLQSHGQYASAGMGAQATSYGAVQYHSPIGLPIGGTHHPGSPAYPQSLSQSSPSYMSQGPQHYSQAGSGMMHAQPQSVRLLGVTGPPTLASSRQNADMGSSQHFDMRSAPYISHTVASPARVRSSPLETSYHHPSAQYQHKLYQGSTASHSPYDHGHHMSPGPVAYPPPSTVPQSYLSSPSQPYPQNSSDWNQQTYESHPSGGNLRSSGHFQHRGQGNY